MSTFSVRPSERLRIEVIDTTCESSAVGMRVDVFILGVGARKLCSGVVDSNGVVDSSVLATDVIVPGEYEVVFYIADYFRDRVTIEKESPLLDTVPFRFTLAGTQPYLLPVRIAPWSFALAHPFDPVTAAGANVLR
jgi:5-hydroxyisourate hydrolase-like protein (transthyretin family)